MAAKFVATFSISAADVAPSTVVDGQRGEILRHSVNHPAKGGPAVARLSSLGLRFEKSSSVALTHGLNGAGSGSADDTGSKIARSRSASPNVTSKLVKPATNLAPTTTGIADLVVFDSSSPSVVDLFPAFHDAEDPSSALNYTLTQNSNAALFDFVSIEATTGKLSLSYAGNYGSAQLTVRATDTLGKSVETSFQVKMSALATYSGFQSVHRAVGAPLDRLLANSHQNLLSHAFFLNQGSNGGITDLPRLQGTGSSRIFTHLRPKLTSDLASSYKASFDLQTWTAAVRNVDNHQNTGDLGDGSVRVELSALGSSPKSFMPVQTQLIGSKGALLIPPLPANESDNAGNGAIQVVAALAPPPPNAGVPIASSAIFPGQSVLTSTQPRASHVVVADLNGDGFLDVIAASQGGSANFVTYPGSIICYRGNGNGTFNAPQIITNQLSGAYAISVADLNLDGKMDVIATSISTYEVLWYKQNADGSFTLQPTLATSASYPSGLAIGDLDNDGNPDVIWSSLIGSKISWGRNNGDGTFAPPQTITTQTSSPWTVIAADLDGDGVLDLVTASIGGHTVEWYRGIPDLLGKGTGTFEPKRLLTPLPNDPDAAGVFCVAAADLDGDGYLDVIAGYGTTSKVVWFRNNHDFLHTFSPRQLITNQATTVYSVVPADMNGDGKIDIVTASAGDDKIAWFQNLGGGNFGDPDSNQTVISTDASYAYAAAVGDFNQDGKLDVASASQDDAKVAAYINTGGQTSVSTSDVAPAEILNGQRKAMLRVDVSSRGVAGNDNARLDSLSLLFEASPGVPLTTAQANALIDNLYIYADTNNSGSYEAGSDLSIAVISSLTLNAGKLTAVITSNPLAAQIAPGTTRSFFVVPQLMTNAASQAPNSFRITNVMQGSGETTARDAVSSVLLSAEAPAVSSVSSTTTTVHPNGSIIVAAGESKTTSGGVYDSIVIGDGGTLTLSTPGNNLVVAAGESKTTSGGVYDSIVIGDGGTLTLSAIGAAPLLTTQSLDSWRSQVFTASELNNVQVSGPLADFDGDGLNTLMEFALNLNPKVSAKTTMTAGTGIAGLPLIKVESVAGQQRLTAEFVRRRTAGAPGISYVMEFSSDLANPAAWSSTRSTEAVTPIDGTWERVKVTDSQPASPIRYGRLRVTMP